MVKLTKRTVIHVHWHAGFNAWIAVVAGNCIGIASPNMTKPELIRGLAIQAKTLLKDGLLSQIVVHGKNGKIQREYTYGADPRRSKG